MHPEAWEFISKDLAEFRDQPIRVLELGSRDVNGSPRGLFTQAEYVGVDVLEGPGVDIVADAAKLDLTKTQPPFDLVVCTEVFEHAIAWRQIVKVAYNHLAEGGAFIGTAAGYGREEHSVNGHLLNAWIDSLGMIQGIPPNSDGVVVVPPDVMLEYYENITWTALNEALGEAGFNIYTVTENKAHCDIYWWAEKFPSGNPPARLDVPDTSGGAELELGVGERGPEIMKFSKQRELVAVA